MVTIIDLMEGFMDEYRRLTKEECKFIALDTINTVLEALDKVGRTSLNMTRYDQVYAITIYNEDRLENIVSKLKKSNVIYLRMLNEIRLELLKLAEDIDSGKEAFVTNYCDTFVWPEPIDVNKLYCEPDDADMKASDNDETIYN